MATYNQRYVGDTGNYLQVCFVHANLAPYVLNDIDETEMTFRIKNVSNGKVRDGKGSWVIKDGTLGTAEYQWNEDDVSEPGLVQIQTTIPFTEGEVTFQPIEIEFINRFNVTPTEITARTTVLKG